MDTMTAMDGGVPVCDCTLGFFFTEATYDFISYRSDSTRFTL
jgi:hypothetical protein